MASEAKQLTKNGKRAYTRGWPGAKFVKRQSAKKARRNVRRAIRDNEGEVLHTDTKGWAW